jgi:1-acyl-sn-glycerol-3-phosphate acyltransferase
MPEIRVKVDFSALLNTADNKNTDRFCLKDQAEDFIQAKILSDSPIECMASTENISSQ